MRPDVRLPVSSAVAEGVGLSVHLNGHSLVCRVNILLHLLHHAIGHGEAVWTDKHRLDGVLPVPEGEDDGPANAVYALAPRLVVLAVAVLCRACNLLENAVAEVFVVLCVRAVALPVNLAEAGRGHALHGVAGYGNVSALDVVAFRPRYLRLKVEGAVLLVLAEGEVVAAVIVEKSPACRRAGARVGKQVLGAGGCVPAHAVLRRPEVEIFAVGGNDKDRLKYPVEVCVELGNFVDRGRYRVEKNAPLPGVDSLRGHREYVLHQGIIGLRLKHQITSFTCTVP